MPTRQSRPQRLDILLEQKSPEGSLEYCFEFQSVEQHALALLKLNTIVTKLLSPPLQPWCRVANYRQNILILEIANGSWMMRLRYEQLNLLLALRKEILPSLCSIHTRINPRLMTEFHDMKQKFKHTQKETGCSNHLRGLSVKTAQALMNLATKSPKKLSEALTRLASLATNIIS